MDIATLIGVVGALGLIIWAILMGGSLNQFVDVPSMIIVIGGTIMALLSNFPLPKVISLISILKKTFFGTDVDPRGFIEKIVSYAEQARKEGMLALEEHAEKEENDFLRKGLRLAVDGNDPALLQKIMETDIEQQQTRHLQGKKILESGGTYAPAFGMIGTLVGLINMLAGLDDPSSIGAGMADVVEQRGAEQRSAYVLAGGVGVLQALDGVEGAGERSPDGRSSPPLDRLAIRGRVVSSPGDRSRIARTRQAARATRA